MVQITSANSMDINIQTLAITTTVIFISITTFLLLNRNTKTAQNTMSTPSKFSSTITSPIPTPAYGPSGYFTIIAKTFIPNASPAGVLSTIRDTKTWSEWNSFTPFFEFKSGSTSSPASRPSSDAGIPTGNEGWLDLGSEGTMTVFMAGDGLDAGKKGKSREQGMVISVLEPISSSPNPSLTSPKGYRIAWQAIGFAQWQMYSERVTELVEVDEEGRKGTEYTCWETFGGVLAPVIKLTLGGTLRTRFGEYADGLRGFCEGQMGGIEESAGENPGN